MRHTLERLFAPLLNHLEKGEGPVNYRSSHRTILKAVSALFFLLAMALLALGINTGQIGILLPCLVFFAVASTALVVATLGSDRAVSRLWHNR